MIKLILTAAVGLTLIACVESDPTHKTKYNFKNTVHTKTDTHIEQQDKSECLTQLNIQIADTYVFEPGQEDSKVIVAHAKDDKIVSTLVIDRDENTPEGLELEQLVNGEYLLTYDGHQDVFSDHQNFSKFKINLVHDVKKDSANLLDGCQNEKEIEVYFIKPQFTAEEQ